jgi:hypothetical protein
MFGLVKRKPAPLPSSVAPELRAQLKPETSFPHLPRRSSEAGCSEVHVEGQPPAAAFVAAHFSDATQSAFRIASSAGLPPLCIVNVRGERQRPQFWELASDADPVFVRQIPVCLEAPGEQWVCGRAFDVVVLPGGLLGLGVGYSTGRPFQQVAVYDRRSGQLRKLADALSFSVAGSSNEMLKALDAGADGVLLLYHTDELRLRAESYARQHDHIVLFSPRHPRGLEVLKLGLDDGNIIDWNLVDETLWMHTQDQRSPQQRIERFWSLNLASVL